MDIEISKELQERLLHLARTSLAQGVIEAELPAVRGDEPILQEFLPVFVTLTKNGDLRGCIGTIQPHLPFGKAVQQYALAAAFGDPRFESVTPAELPELRIEISVLSPMRRVKDASEIIPGVHGVMVEYGICNGIFLPQVWKQLPDKEEFLGRLCTEKAGLPFKAWQEPDVELKVFTVTSFEEP